MQSKENFIAKATPLLLILFIDGMGLGLVFPILNGLIFDPHSGFLQGTFSPLLHTVIYGGIIGIFMLCWFFGSALLGDLSDKIGRKKALVICLVGAFLSYLISAFAVELHSLTLLLMGRVISGLTSGSQPIAQAAIVDISHEEHKPRNIGYILLALSLGFIFGPLLGGVLSDKTIVSWFTFATPFYFAASIALLNIVLLVLFFKESFISKNTTFRINPYQAIDIFISAFKHPAIKTLSIIFLIFILGWSSFFSFIALYLLKIYDFSPTDVSFFMALMGVGFGIGNGFLVNLLAKRFYLRNTFMVATFITGLIIFAMTFAQSAFVCWMLIPFMSMSLSVAYASVLTLFSNQVDAASQGWVMGITGSVSALVFGIDGLALGFLAALNAHLPMVIAASCLLISAIATGLFFKRD